MNKNLYRIVFNKARGILMVVAENTSGKGTGDSDSNTSGVSKPAKDLLCTQMRQISFAAKLAAGMMTLVMPFAHAQIIADPNAPSNQRPTILGTANGLPQVNIQAPSAAGVSRNTYSQFDVQSNGAILNNSRTNTATQTGGWIQGNPWLVGGAARVILNEVNSSNPSQLRGYIEVAGQRAEVIIANPAGIQVNGGGFINADRVTLTTGTAVINQANGGSLDSYRIPQGMISIDGLGLDTRTANYTDILARSVQVNAGIWANRLKVVTGANQVSTTSADYPGDVSQGVTPIAGTGPVPQFSLDVAAIGGMYAGHIYLVGSESGLGVRNKGAINAAGGNLVLLSNGFLTNEGAIQAASSNGSGGNVRVDTAGAISNVGSNAIISAQGQATIVTATDLTNAAGAKVETTSSLAITAASITNAGTLAAGDAMTVTAVDIDNAATGEIVGDTNKIKATNSLVNRGLIDGSGVLIQAGTLDNIGTGRIFGDDLGIAANVLNNDSETLTGVRSDAVIAARQRLDLGVGTFNNRNGSLLFSAGSGTNALNIGGSLDAQGLATGTAGTINNAAGTIESLGGANISALQLNNINPDFSTRTDTSYQAASAYYIRLGGTRYLESNTGRCFRCASDRNDSGDVGLPRLEYVAPSSQYPFEAGYSRVPYQLTAEIYNEETDSYSTDDYAYPVSSPVWALFAVPVGDQVMLRGRLLGYNQNLIARSYRDFYHIWVTSTETVQTVVDNPGTSGRIISGSGMKLSGGSILNDNSQILAGGNLDITGSTLTSTETSGHRQVTDFGTFRGDTVEYSPYRLRAGYFGTGSYVFVSESVSTKLDTSLAAGNTSGSGTGTQLTTRTAPTSSLLILNPDANDSHIYKGDPRFNNQRQWLSSDYMLQVLATDPNTIQKRLGDGFYEQKLIREQVAQLTGRRFLDGYASDEAQYQALMQSGVTYAQKWNLVPGIALTASQVAQLTSDMVWLVAQEVVLPDGTKTMALVPQLYAMPKTGDLNANGALLAGQSVNIQLTGDLKNSGTIGGRNVMQINADNVQNLGTMAGKTVSVSAQQDLINLGGRIMAEDSLAATANRDLTVQSTTSTSSASAGRSSSSLTQVDRVAGLYVTGSTGILVASAGRDFNVLAGVLSSAGNVQVTAGNSVNLATIDNSYKSDLTANDRNYMRESGTQEVGSVIVSGGSTVIAAGKDLNARAAVVNAKGDLAVVAGGAIQLVEGRATSETDDARYAKSKNFGSSSTTESHTQSQSNTAIGTNLVGKAITVSSGTDILVRGSNVISSDGTTIVAGKNISVEAAINTSESSSFNETKKSGLISSKNNKQVTDTFDTQVVGSSIAGNTITLSAGNDATIVGSHINAVNDATIIAGNDVTIVGAIENHAVSQVSEIKKSGFSASFQSGVSLGSNNGIETLNQNGQTVVTSSVSGTNVQITANRDVGVLGSAILADKDIRIDAGRNINIDVIKEMQTTESTSKNSSTTMGLSPSLSGSQTIFGTTADKQNGQSEGQSSITSLLSANTGNLTLVAGNAGTQDSTITTRGADLIAGKTIKLEADRIDLLASRDTTSSRNDAESKSFTVGARPAGAIGGTLSAIAENAMNAAEGTGNSRLDGALALKAGYDSYKLLANSQQFADSLNNAAADAAATDGSGAAFGVSVSIGSAKSSSSSITANANVTGTNLQAKEIDLIARQTDIHLEGAKLQAESIKLDAARNVILEAAANTGSLQSTNSSSSASVGATLGFGQQNGLSFQLGVQNGKGKANGEETTYDNTLITATEKLSIKSGNDTTLEGAQLAAKQVTLDVGRNLNIETLQDSSRYQSEQKSGGFGISLCIPPICYGASSVSVNMSNQSIKHNYQSAQGQSGIVAGTDGFDIKVGQHTELVGAAITSTAKPEDNKLTTGSISSRDIVNVQDTDAKSSSFSASVIYGGGAGSALSQLAKNGAANLLGNLTGQTGLPEDVHETGQTQSVISPAQITLTGNTEQNIQSQETIVLLTSRDPETANQALTNKLTLQQTAQLEQDLKITRQNQQAAQMVGSVLTNVIGDIAKSQTKAYDLAFKEKDNLQKALTNATDPATIATLQDSIAKVDTILASNQDQYDLWKEGGVAKIGLHGLAGYLEGRVSGGPTGAAVFAAVSNEVLSGAVNDAIRNSLKDDDRFKIKDGDSEQEKINKIKALENTEKAYGEAAATLIGSLAGALVAGKDGAAIGGSVALIAEQNNRQLHPSETKWIEDNAARYAARNPGMTTQEAEIILAQQAFRQVQYGAQGTVDAQAMAFLREAQGMLPADPTCSTCGGGTMFYARPEQKANANMYASTLAQTAAFYQKNGLTQPNLQQIVAGTNKAGQDIAFAKSATIAAVGIAGAVAGAGPIAAISGIPIFSTGGALGSGMWASPVGTAVISGGINAGAQYGLNGTVNPVDVAIAMATGGVGAYGGFLWNVGVNTAGGAIGTSINNSLSGQSNSVIGGAVTGGALSTIGYGAGYATQKGINSMLRPTINNANVWSGTGIWSSGGYNLFMPNNGAVIGGSIGGGLAQEVGDGAIKK